MFELNISYWVCIRHKSRYTQCESSDTSTKTLNQCNYETCLLVYGVLPVSMYVCPHCTFKDNRNVKRSEI